MTGQAGPTPPTTLTPPAGFAPPPVAAPKVVLDPAIETYIGTLPEAQQGQARAYYEAQAPKPAPVVEAPKTEAPAAAGTTKPKAETKPKAVSPNAVKLLIACAEKGLPIAEAREYLTELRAIEASA